MKYFTQKTYNATNLKKEMHSLSMKLHPDKWGSTKDFCEMTKEYKSILSTMQNGEYKSAESTEPQREAYKYQYQNTTQKKEESEISTESAKSTHSSTVNTKRYIDYTEEVEVPLVFVDFILISTLIGGLFNFYIGLLFLVHLFSLGRGTRKWRTLSAIMYLPIFTLIHYDNQIAKIMAFMDLANFLTLCMCGMFAGIFIYVYKLALDS